MEGTGVEWRGREWSGGEGRGGEGRAGQGRAGQGARLLRWTFTGRDFIPLTRPWNGQPPSISKYIIISHFFYTLYSV